MATIGRRGRPDPRTVFPYQGAGLGLPVTTQLPTRQWERPARRVRQVIPIDWRPEGPQLVFGSEPPAGPAAAQPCEDCD